MTFDSRSPVDKSVKSIFCLVLALTFVSSRSYAQPAPSAQADSLCNAAYSLFESGQYADAKSILESGMPVFGEGYSIYVYGLLSQCYYQLEDYQGALSSLNTILPSLNKLYREDEAQYAEAYLGYLEYASSCCLHLNDFKQRTYLRLTAIEIKRKYYSEEERSDYLDELNSVARLLTGLKDYEQAVPLYEEYLLLTGKESPNYWIAGNNLAICYGELGRDKDALPLYEEIMTMCRESRQVKPMDYATSLWNLAECYQRLRQESDAIRLYEEACAFLKQVYGDYHLEYAESLGHLATCFFLIGRYDEAIPLYVEDCQIKEKELGTAHPDYLVDLKRLAACYAYIGDYSEALGQYEKERRIRERVYGKDNPEYSVLLNNMAGCYTEIGQYEDAVLLYDEALHIQENLGEKRNSHYATLLNNLAVCYSYLGRYEEALRLYGECCKIEKEVYGENDPRCAKSFNNLAHCYHILGDNEKSLELYEKTCEIYEINFGKHHPGVALALCNKGCLFYDIHDIRTAESLLKESLSIFNEGWGKSHPHYAQVLVNLAACYQDEGCYEDAISLQKEALGIIKESLGEKHLKYGLVLRSLALSHLYLNDLSQGVKTARRVSNLFMDELSEKFHYLTAGERGHYLKRSGCRTWFSEDLQAMAYRFPCDSLISIACDGTLFNKGLLLNSEREFKVMIEESEDIEAMQMFEQLRRKLMKLDRLRNIPLAERSLNADSLAVEAQTLEHRLMSRSKVFGDYTRRLSVSWKQVQEHLKEGEAAIEFVSFPIGKDSLMYAAYVIKPGTDVVWVPLFEEAQLIEIPSQDYYTTSSLSELTWKPLESNLEGVKTVYFAPSGQLYHIAIESVPDWKTSGFPVSNSRDYYRLSSTRELALTGDKHQWKNAAVYGGLAFSMDADELLSDSRKYRTAERSGKSLPVHELDFLNLRAGVAYLPGTLEEALCIQSTLENASIHTEAYMDTMGTETSFKDLSGRGFNVIHIGTHGFFYGKKTASGAALRLYFNDADQLYLPVNKEDWSMEYSGLLFAGANFALKGNRLPEGVDDGILTAKELARIDFRGLDLIVLSACQTGLGEITGDGVFGLQRGFKKAGANTILMSLWKVDDTATRLLMSRFFENIAEGMSKHDALKDAQKYVRNYELESPETGDNTLFELVQTHIDVEKDDQRYRPFADPYYWAAFILLDGIN